MKRGSCLRVMLVVNEFPPEKIAGTAMATKSLAEHLMVRGHAVCVVVTTACPQNKQTDIAPHDYQLIWLKPCFIKGLGWLSRIWQTFKHTKSFQPDVIQGQAVSCGLIAGVTGHLLHIPSLCYAQGYDVYQASWWQRKTEIRWGCGWPDKLLAVTHHLVDAIGAATAIKTAAVMPHAFEKCGVMPVRDAVRGAFGVNAEDRIVLTVGRLEHFKGHDVLLKAWAGIIGQMPDAQLWIVGSGSQHDALVGMIKAYEITSSVNLIGQLSADAVHERMAAADVFVLPSRSEPFGIVLLEAMTHSLPIIASDVGGIPEVVPTNEDIQLVPADSVERLKVAVLKWYGKENQCSNANREHAMRFEWTRQVKRFEEIYHTMLTTEKA